MTNLKPEIMRMLQTINVADEESRIALEQIFGALASEGTTVEFHRPEPTPNNIPTSDFEFNNKDVGIMDEELKTFKRWIESKGVDLATYSFVAMDMSGDVTARRCRPEASTQIWVYGGTSINVGRYMAGRSADWTRMIIEF